MTKLRCFTKCFGDCSCCKCCKSETQEGETIFFSVDKHNEGFPDNYVSTTKYTPLTFVPLNLFEQFRRVSNIYFLLQMIVSLIPTVSPISPLTTILPLMFVLGVAMAKDGYEDLQRHKADKKANKRPHIVVKDGELKEVRAQDLYVGDVVYMKKDEQFPADLILFSCSNADPECYIETANLDGETVLKPKHCIAELEDWKDPTAFVNKDVDVECVPPSENLNAWEGKIIFPDQNKSVPVGLEQFLFRGCTLRNTQFCYGTVVYTGKNTKVMLNLKPKAAKMSLMDKKLNKLIIAVGIINISMVIILSTLACFWNGNTGEDSWYLTTYIEGTAATFCLSFLTFFLILSYMIPISLFVSIEFCKAIQSKLMEWDLKMAHNGRTMSAKTSNLNEDLAQVKYIFTDKTGTLTENVMIFHRLSVHNFFHNENTRPMGLKAYIQSGGWDDWSKSMRDDLNNFIRCLLMCNTVVLAYDEETGKIRPEGTSSDEVALVQGMMDNDFNLVHRTRKEIKILMLEEQEEYSIEAILPFSPERKRMSVVLRSSDGRTILFTKGADSAMLPLCKENAQSTGEWTTAGPHKSSCIAQLHDMSVDGLRTLVLGMRELDPQVYDAWKKTWDSACLAVGKSRLTLTEAACVAIEEDLVLLGASGIEDKLQDGVPDTIKFFLMAGVVIWVLTGDKRETAVNIAASAAITEEGDRVMHIDAKGDSSLLETQLCAIYDTLFGAKDDVYETKAPVVICFDGISLELILNNKEMKEKFAEVCKAIKSAIACRLTPLHKAAVVEMFQTGNNYVCLSVGDGANDVSMIQEARVGIGIMGLEGSQAELAADYAIPKFRHLIRLCAVHGRYSVVRNTFLIFYNMYKNNAIALIQFAYVFYNGFSGTTFFNEWLLSLKNVIFTHLPGFFGGMFEKDLPEEELERDPQLFAEISYDAGINIMSSCMWYLSSVTHALVIFYTLWPTMDEDDWTYWRTSGWSVAGNVAMTVLVYMVLCKAVIHIYYWQWIMIASVAGSVIFYWLIQVIYSALPIFVGSAQFYWVGYEMSLSWVFWLQSVLLVYGWVLPVDYGLLMLRRYLIPSYKDYVRAEIQRKQVLKPWEQPYILPTIAIGPLVVFFVVFVVYAIINS